MVIPLPCSLDDGEHGWRLLCSRNRALGKWAKDLAGYSGRVCLNVFQTLWICLKCPKGSTIEKSIGITLACVPCLQTVTAEAVELWADRAMADRGLARMHQPSKRTEQKHGLFCKNGLSKVRVRTNSK